MLLEKKKCSVEQMEMRASFLQDVFVGGRRTDANPISAF